MNDKKSESSPENLIERPSTALSVERVDPSELVTVARVLALAYTEDPIHIWAMPKAETRLADATMFFTFYLRWMLPHSWDVFATADRSAVLVTSLAPKGRSPYPDGVRYLPKLVRTKSSVNDYFQWIETFRPKVDHRYLEFIGCFPAQRSKGIGSLLLGSLLTRADREGFPVWTWSSNPRNLTFYQRLGFEIGAELRLNHDAPPVTIIWRPAARP
jgi:GNAT superfamily N-acetyltransferase